ncbi:CarboxypepD_reg-like domain-containing protein [Mesonia phycicola]|uniref:CarboxypepD_reg-like domain-containing protein n=1 Tax=Mesonia phycicola TaxID=579105 RepID=A0A1M6EEW2_9FLAO|nr:carboxypeptidase-like regulatory domain-containing protein [Mesonia phycicola]SHI83919.1 CarboxypepD_reg-like domain-containing protein [Mesonia phycicola]
MKKVYFFLTFLCCSIVAFAQQTTIKGKVVDASNNEALPNTQVSIENTIFSVDTDAEGNFNFNTFSVPLGEQIITLEKQGYIKRRYPVIINEGEALDLDVLEMEADINEENFQIGTISLSDNELSSDESTADNMSGLLQASKDVFLNAASFDFSATFFRPRGYDNENGKVLINGIEMNKQYDGRPQWSSWGGLNDAQRNQEFTMGLKANEYTFGGLSGTNNIVMRASQYREGGRVSYAAANRSYTGRVMASYNTGLMQGGWAFSFLASRRFGEEGFTEGTSYDANSFFASVEKQLSEKHSLNFTGFFTPNRRGKSTAITEEVKELKGIDYNPNWGYLDGDKRNARHKEIAEPVLMLNHYWDISNKTKLNTNVAYQFGKIGNTRIDNGGTKLVETTDGQTYYAGGASNPSPIYYQNLPSYHLRYTDLTAANYQAAYLAREEFQNDGQLDWNALYEANTIAVRNGGNSIYAIQEDRQDDTQFTANTILTSDINENITFNSSLNYRHLKSEYFAELNDLLGGTGYLDVDFFAEETQEDTDIDNIAQSDVNNPNRIVQEGERYKYNYEIEANVATAFAQAQFKYNKVDFYVAGNLSNTTYQRTGLYENGYFMGNSFGKGEKLDFTNYGAKAGATYKITGRHLLDLNTGYYTTAPSIRNSYSNARQNHNTVAGLESEKVQSVDLSYIFRTPTIKARLTGFYTQFQDGTDIGFYFTQDLSGFGIDEGDAFVQEIVNGIDRRNMGAEFGIEAQVTPTIKLKAAGSIGQYVYTNNPDIYLTSDDFIPNTNQVNANGEVRFGDGKTNLKDYHVAGGPERALQFGFEYRDPNYWWVGATSNYFSNAYIDISALNRSSNFARDYDGLLINDYDADNARNLLEQEQFDDYMLFNIVGGKSWRIDDYYIGFFATINNVFNQEYKTGGFEQSRNSNYTNLNEDQSRENGSLFGNRYFYGYGTTYYLNLYIRF